MYMTSILISECIECEIAVHTTEAVQQPAVTNS